MLNGLNVELLLKVKEQILKEPQLFDMSEYAEKKDCGTACCIGGWAIALSGYEFDWEGDCPVSIRCNGNGIEPKTHVSLLAQKLLNIGDKLSLFYVPRWENELFKDKYCKAKTNNERAEATAEYIDWYITNYDQKVEVVNA